jgi:uncharacterized membrane protein
MTGAMAVLVVLLASCVFYRVLGAFGVDAFEAWLTSARWAVSTMLLFTALSHFAPMKKDLIAMVPPFLPRPNVLVSVTGVAEVAGAIGLLIPQTRLLAAYGLILLLLALLPANVSAARRGVLLRGRRATSLWLRVPMQALFIVWLWAVR